MALSLRSASAYRLAVLLQALEAVGGTFAELDDLVQAQDLVTESNDTVAEAIAEGDDFEGGEPNAMLAIVECMQESAWEAIAESVERAKAHIQGL